MSRRLRWGWVLALGATLLPSLAWAGTLGSPLQIILALRERGEQRREWDRLLPGIMADEVGLSVRLRAPLDDSLETRIESLGAELRRGPDGQPLHLGSIYALKAPWSSVRALAHIPEVERVELARRPGLRPHLDVSAREVEAPRVWARSDSLGRAIDGTGIVAADFDSGIDVFHPLFFRADGGVFEWLDTTGNGVFDPGVDAVDLDGNGAADPGETLELIEGMLVQSAGWGWVDGSFDTDLDWLYNDADGNGVRAFGPEAGYTDLDPSFGERLFVAVDDDGDGRLDVGESLLALNTSKIIATLMWPDVIRHRGVDLIETPLRDLAWEREFGEFDDRPDHGTGVGSVLVGGWSDLDRRITGIAPGAELILVDFTNELGLPATLAWALGMGAKVGSHPYGYRMFNFLDGSSLDEEAIDQAVEQGMLQVTSVGNEARDRDNASVSVPPQGVVDMLFEVLNYHWQNVPISLVALTVRWRRPEARLSIGLIDPEGNEASMGFLGTSTSIGSAQVDASRETSSRGTAKLDIVVTAREGVAQGDWMLRLASDDDEEFVVHATIANDYFGGGMGTNFTDEEQVDINSTVNAPATADGALGACSYGTRHSSGGEVIGALSGFSARGPRIDGARIVDLCAPGDNDIIWALSSREGHPFGSFEVGGGTSASAPHIAGAIALLFQGAPEATPAEIELALFEAAFVDDLVEQPVPNHTWGYGKLRVEGALELLGSFEEEERRSQDLTPWDEDVTVEPDLSPLVDPYPVLNGVEGGGCHCRSADAASPAWRSSVKSLVAALLSLT